MALPEAPCGPWRVSACAAILAQSCPFELSAYVDGKLVLRDPATGERIHLESFGAGNAAVFAQLHRVGLPSSSQGVKP